MIRKYFNKEELLNLVTSNFYSILYYNSEIWHLPTLKPSLKQKLLSTSAKALKVCKNFDSMTSFNYIHTSCKRASPEQMMKYKMALCLFKLYNQEYNSIEFLLLNFNQVLTTRQTTFKLIKNNRTRVGLNSLANRLYLLNGFIPLVWLNSCIGTFKVNCKKLFLH